MPVLRREKNVRCEAGEKVEFQCKNKKLSFGAPRRKKLPGGQIVIILSPSLLL